MADAQRKSMTVEEFLEWNLLQDERFELVDGFAVPLRPRVDTTGMAGTTDQHDTITVNLIIAIGNQLRNSGCRPKTADTAVRTKIKNVRRPDVTVECSPVEKGSLEARNPVAVFEVLSPTTRKIDRTIKLQEYLKHPSLRTIVHIDPDELDVVVFTRGANGDWSDTRLDYTDDVLTLSGLSVSLPLSAIYEGVPVAEKGQRPVE